MQHTNQAIPNMEFGRRYEFGQFIRNVSAKFLAIFFFRMANERDLEKSDSLVHSNIVFDYSGHFIVYSTMVGVKMVNITTNRCVQIIGKGDNLRPLHVALFQVGLRFCGSTSLFSLWNSFCLGTRKTIKSSNNNWTRGVPQSNASVTKQWSDHILHSVQVWCKRIR